MTSTQHEPVDEAIAAAVVLVVVVIVDDTKTLYKRSYVKSMIIRSNIRQLQDY